MRLPFPDVLTSTTVFCFLSPFPDDGHPGGRELAVSISLTISILSIFCVYWPLNVFLILLLPVSFYLKF